MFEVTEKNGIRPKKKWAHEKSEKCARNLFRRIADFLEEAQSAKAVFIQKSAVKG